MTELNLSDIEYVARIYQGRTYYLISPDVASRILKNDCNHYSPLGHFLLKEGDKWVAIDNEGGCAWTEEFTSKRVALNWLLFNKYGSVEDAHKVDERAEGLRRNIEFKRKFAKEAKE